MTTGGKVLVMGAGFTGCTFARLLADQGYKVLIKERASYLGGLSCTMTSPNGLLYEPFGARTVHTNHERVKAFLLRFAEFNSYTHRKGMIVNGNLLHFPISLETIETMQEKQSILKELENLPGELDRTNFETCMISMLGPTLYRLFIKNYTEKMWGVQASSLTAEWAPKRLEITARNAELFRDQWQGLPVGGYTRMFERMIEGIEIQYEDARLEEGYDLTIYSGRLDELLNYRYGKLPYRSLTFTYVADEAWEHEAYGTINLPQHPECIRKANFRILHQARTDRNWIQYQRPVAASAEHVPMYPMNTASSDDLFARYLMEACQNDRIVPVGRLGLFKYLDMDKAIALCMDMMPVVESWRSVSPERRAAEIRERLKHY